MRKYIVRVDNVTTTCNLFSFLLATFYRKLRNWSKPRIIGSYLDVS